ncbi:hypothetical protein NV63_17720 [Elizabethkingia anophelis]|nr:hypothetical protein NV63_17720 [Elizabethkingia anophelis]
METVAHKSFAVLRDRAFFSSDTRSSLCLDNILTEKFSINKTTKKQKGYTSQLFFLKKYEKVVKNQVQGPRIYGGKLS